MRILFVFLIVCTIANGQNHEKVLDSIKNLITDQSTIDEKISIHLDRLTYCYTNSVDSATFFKVMKEFEIEENCHDCPFIARNSLGHFYYTKNEFDKSEKYFERSIKESKSVCDYAYNNSLSWLTQINLNNGSYEKAKQNIDELIEYNKDENPEVRFNAYFLLGGIQREQGYSLSAINSFHNADSCTSLFKDNGFRFICKSKVYNNLGNTFREIKDYENAEYYINKGIESSENTKYKDEIPFLKMSLAILNADQKKYVESSIVLDSLEKTFERQSNFDYELGEVFFYKGICKHGLGEYKEALIHFEKAKRIYKAHGNFLTLAETIAYMANCYMELKELNKASILLDSAITIANEIEIEPIQISTLDYMIKLSVLNKEFEKSYELILVRDSLKQIIQNRIDKNRVIDRETQFQTQLKDEELKFLKASKELDDQKQKQKENILIGGIILTSIIGVMLFFLFRNRQNTNRKLKEIDTIKTRFFENISHEFRTPLTLIKLPLSQAIHNKEELDLKELNLMHNNASRLQNLIEDLLSLSELEAGKMEIKKSDQDPLVQAKTLSSQFDSYAESKGINYHKVIERNSIKATYDKSVVDKVLANLISNAIKYSETGGEVQVSVSIVDQKLVMKVSDKGDGISPADQEKIFERFYRVGETDEGKQGSGIGLALVKKLLEINSGTIEVTSKINEGSTFTASIPMENIVQLPFEPLPEKTKEKKYFNLKKEDLLESIELSDKPKLLITEDSKELLTYISTLFKEDFQLIDAKDGEEGMKKALEHVPDFIISDWMMPNKNGLEFCKDVKTNSITSHIPFLLLTAKSMVEDKIEGYDTGADAYFSKPFNFNELKARVNSLLKQRKLLYDKFSYSDIQLSGSSNNSLDIEFWQEFKSYLKQHIKESDLLSATQFSEHLGMSRMQLHRKLIALTGKNLSTFVKNQRMNLACELLKDKSLRISDVCYEIGYEDKSAFARVFKQEFGVTPTQFRKNLDES